MEPLCTFSLTRKKGFQSYRLFKQPWRGRQTEAQCNTELTRLKITDCSEVGNVALWRPCTCLVRTKTQSVSHIQKSLYSFHISLMRPTNTFQSSWGTFGGPSTSLKSTRHSYGDKLCGKINKTGIENIRGVSFQYNSSFVFAVCVGSWKKNSYFTTNFFLYPNLTIIVIH